jgi:tRNA-binding EMAP/Myf-like protein
VAAAVPVQRVLLERQVEMAAVALHHQSLALPYQEAAVVVVAQLVQQQVLEAVEGEATVAIVPLAPQEVRTQVAAAAAVAITSQAAQAVPVL